MCCFRRGAALRGGGLRRCGAYDPLGARSRAVPHRDRRQAGRTLHADQRRRHGGVHHQFRRPRGFDPRARPRRCDARRGARLRQYRRLPDDPQRLRRRDRPLCQPHRPRPLRTGRDGLSAAPEQLRALPARRSRRLAVPGLRRGGGHTLFADARPAVARRRRRLSGQRDGPGEVYAHRGQCAADRLRGRDRRPDDRQYDQPHLFLPLGRSGRGVARRRAADRRVALYAGRFDLHDYGRDRSGRGYADGFPYAEARGGGDRRFRVRTAPQRPRLRPQLGARHGGRCDSSGGGVCAEARRMFRETRSRRYRRKQFSARIVSFGLGEKMPKTILYSVSMVRMSTDGPTVPIRWLRTTLSPFSQHTEPRLV